MPESVLSSSAYLEVIIEIMNNKAGVREDDERRRAFKAAITEHQRRRDETLAQFAVRRQRDFTQASQHGVVIPDVFKATLLREGAGLNEQNQQNLSALLQGQEDDPQAVARALGRLDVRSDRITGFAEEVGKDEVHESFLGDFPDEEESLDDEEIVQELESLDLTEDQVTEIFAVIDQKRRRPRSWKENKEFKAELKKDRGAFVKGGPPWSGPSRDRKGEGPRPGRSGMNREQLKKISRCRICMKKGHWAEDCEVNKAKKPVTAFAYSSASPPGMTSAFSFITLRSLREAVQTVQSPDDHGSWSFLTLPSGAGILDTGATQDLIGEVALRSISSHLKFLGLKPVYVDATTSIPTGIGGAAKVKGVVLLPISPGGFPGVLEMTILEGGIPPLLSVGFLEFLESSIDLTRNVVTMSKLGIELPLNRLSSGHRTMELFDWKTNMDFPVPDELSTKYQLEPGAFNLRSLSAYTKSDPSSPSLLRRSGVSIVTSVHEPTFEHENEHTVAELSAVVEFEDSLNPPDVHVHSPCPQGCSSRNCFRQESATICTTRDDLSGHQGPLVCEPPQPSGSSTPMGTRLSRDPQFAQPSCRDDERLSPESRKCCPVRAMGTLDGLSDESLGDQSHRLQAPDPSRAEHKEHGIQPEEVHRGRVPGTGQVPSPHGSGGLSGQSVCLLDSVPSVSSSADLCIEESTIPWRDPSQGQVQGSGDSLRGRLHQLRNDGHGIFTASDEQRLCRDLPDNRAGRLVDERAEYSAGTDPRADQHVPARAGSWSRTDAATGGRTTSGASAGGGSDLSHEHPSDVSNPGSHDRCRHLVADGDGMAADAEPSRDAGQSHRVAGHEPQHRVSHSRVKGSWPAWMLASGLTWAGLVLEGDRASPELHQMLQSFNLDDEAFVFQYDLLGCSGPEQAHGEPALCWSGPEQALGAGSLLPSGPVQALGEEALLHAGPEQASLYDSKYEPSGAEVTDESENYSSGEERSTMSPSGLRDEDDGWPIWVPPFMTRASTLLGCSEGQPVRNDHVPCWRRVLEADSGHVISNGPVIDSSQTFVNNHSYPVRCDEWGCPAEFLRLLMMTDPDRPIIGFNKDGKTSSQGPFWAAAPGPQFTASKFPDGAEEIANDGHATDLQRCFNNLSFMAKQANRSRIKSSRDFVELFSPPRVTPYAQKMGLAVETETIFDLQHGWDVRESKHRKSFRTHRERHRPRMLMTSPACRAYTHLRHIFLQKMNPEVRRKVLLEGQLMWDFSLEACQDQIKDDNYFGLEHPRLAASWRLPQTQRLLRRPDVALIVFDQCAYGLSVVDSGKLSQKSTCIATNNPWLALELIKAQCSQDHDHEALVSGLPRMAQEYPAAMCMAIARSAQAVSMGLEAPSFFHEVEYEATKCSYAFFGEDEEDEDDDLPVESTTEPAPLSESQRRLVMKVHVNTGHPDRQRMLRAFRAAGALPQVLTFIRKEFQCEDCNLKQGTDNRRRAQLPRTFSFNRVVCVDFLYVRFKEAQIPIMNAVCAGTSYQIAARCPITRSGTPSSSAAWKLFLETWVRYFGAPHMLMTDAGNEFKGAFERGLELQGILQHVIHPECPWENGKAERHGGWLKNRLDSEIQSGRWCLHQPRRVRRISVGPLLHQESMVEQGRLHAGPIGLWRTSPDPRRAAGRRRVGAPRNARRSRGPGRG